MVSVLSTEFRALPLVTDNWVTPCDKTVLVNKVRAEIICVCLPD